MAAVCFGGQMQIDPNWRLHPFQKIGDRQVDVVFSFAVQLLTGIIRHLHMGMEPLALVPAVLVKLRQRNQLAAELLPLSRNEGILIVHERVQHSHIGRSLAGIILDVKQLETAEARGAEAHFDIGLVQLRGPAEGGAAEVRRLVPHPRGFQPAPELHQVVRGQRAGVFVDLGVVRITLELPRLVADDRHGNALERLREVPRRARVEMVQDAAVHRVAESEGTADMGIVLPIGLAPGAAGGKEVHAIYITAPAQEGVGTVRVQDLRGFGPEGFHQLLHHRRLAPELVAQGKHRKGRMVPIVPDDVQALFF